VAENSLPYEKRKDGILFHLRDEVKMLLRWSTSTKVVIEMWRGTDLVPPDTGNLNSANFREKLAQNARAAFTRDGKDTVPNILEDIGMVALAMSSTVDTGDSDDKDRPKTLWDLLKGPSPMNLMIKYAEEAAEFFHIPDMDAYATAKVKASSAHHETYSLRSRRFELWLRREWHRREKERLEEEGNEDEKPMIFPHRALADVVSHFESVALFDGAEEEVYLRVAGREGRIYVDLCDPAWRVVEISPEGWQVIPGDSAPVTFIRKGGMLALPEPSRNGSLEKLRSLLNVGTGDEGERNWRLISAWLAQGFNPKGRYPVLTLLGPQGAAKSSAQRILRNIVDPSSVPIRGVPRDEHNLYIDATSGWVIALDNMTTIPAWLSDALCRLATGGGFSTRRLYTDDDQILFDAMRPVVVNGIGDVVTRPDLLDRALIINLPPIEKKNRRPEKVLEAELEAAKPGILGALFDAVAAGLAGQNKVDLDGLPRMADFARWGVATEEALGGESGSFMKAYASSQDEAVETALEAWPIVAPLWEFAKNFKGEEGAWVGTATKLFNALNESAEDDLKRAADWPKAPNKLTEQINRLAPSLLEVGVYVVRPTHSHVGGRKLKVFYVGPPRK
jgi:hypothetical protein